MSNRYAIILAAGQGTRMKSKLYKVLHPVCGKSMIQHIVDQVNQLDFSKVITVIGHGAELVRERLGQSVNYVLQEEQLGTGHAVLQAHSLLKDKVGTTVVLNGDTPLITEKTIADLLKFHEQSEASATVLTAVADDPKGYGRVIRDQNRLVQRIVEDKDATIEERNITEINTGIFCFDNQLLFDALQRVTNDNQQGEYYLPDVMGILQEQGRKIAAYQTSDFLETIGVNDRVALSRAEKYMRHRINTFHMKQGVTIFDPETTYISSEATIGRDTVIHPGTSILGHTTIGEDCVISSHTELRDSVVGDRTTIKQSVVHDSHIGEEVTIGPFAHIRPQTKLGDQVKIGNFVEVKKSTISDKSKASHLSYIGDAEIGKDVNLGCGSITVNYDGKNKHLTKVEDGAFIGCNVNLVAPVTIGQGAFVAAGSTITDDVENKSLAIARSRQTVKQNYVNKLNSNKN